MASDNENDDFSGENRSAKVVPIDLTQDENINPKFEEKLTREEAKILVSKYSCNILWHIRTLKGRELIGLISGSSTMAIYKIIAGIASITISLNGKSKTLEQDEVGQSFPGNATLSDTYSSMDHEAFLVELINMQNNTTSFTCYKAYGVSPQSSNTFANMALTSGVLLIASGISDFFGAIHLWPSFNDTFESMVHNAVSKFSDDVMLSKKTFNDYLNYAYGGYIDAYQKRGVFNKNSFMYFLTQYKNWEKNDENA